MYLKNEVTKIEKENFLGSIQLKHTIEPGVNAQMLLLILSFSSKALSFWGAGLITSKGAIRSCEMYQVKFEPCQMLRTCQKPS